MKRFIAAVLCMLLLLSGCTKQENKATEIDLDSELDALLNPGSDTPGQIRLGWDDMPMDHGVPKYNIESNGIPGENIVKVDLCAIGDIMAHSGTLDAAKTKDGYDFDNMFADVAKYFAPADYRIANLETSFSGKDREYTGYPLFNTPEQMGQSLRKVLGIDLVSNANNHSLDRNYSGAVTTLDFLDSFGIAHTGTYRTQEEADTTFIADINGAKIAFLSYTYDSNVHPSKDNKYCINIISKEKLETAAEKARNEGADYIIALLHWGTEYQRSSSREQQELAEWLFANTEVDLIIGNHAHVVQPIEKFEVEHNGKAKTGWVFYALGNFTSTQHDMYSDTGIIVHAYISIDTENNENSAVDAIKYTPIMVDPNDKSTGRKYRVVSVYDGIYGYEDGSDPLISKKEYNLMVKYEEYYRELLCIDEIISEMK